MRVREICNSRVETLAESEMLASAADAMRAADVSSLPRSSAPTGSSTHPRLPR
jgi:hypothetical protein